MTGSPQDAAPGSVATRGDQHGDSGESPAERRARYEIEKALATRLRTASPQERRRLYPRLYDELIGQLPFHPRRRRALDSERSRRAVAQQMRWLRPWLSENATFLEVGCGDGTLAACVASAVRQAYGVDVSARLRSREHPSDCPFIVADALQLPIAAARIDVAYSNQFVEHLHPDDILPHLEEVRRVLSPGGVYVCVTPNRLHGPHDVSRGFDTYATGMHLREYTASELSELFRRACFSQVKVHLAVKRTQWILPRRVVLLIESLLQCLPPAWRLALGGSLPFRLLSVVRVSGRKPADHDATPASQGQRAVDSR